MGKKKSKKKNKQDSNQLVGKKLNNVVGKKLNNGILDNKGVRALVTALAAVVVEQLLEAIANQGNDSKDQSNRLGTLGDAIKEAASSLQGMTEGKPAVTETVATVKDAIAEIKPAVTGVLPVVQGVVSILKDKAGDSKAAVQKAISENSDNISDTVQSVRPTAQS